MQYLIKTRKRFPKNSYVFSGALAFTLSLSPNPQISSPAHPSPNRPGLDAYKTNFTVNREWCYFLGRFCSIYRQTVIIETEDRDKWAGVRIQDPHTHSHTTTKRQRQQQQWTTNDRRRRRHATPEKRLPLMWSSRKLLSGIRPLRWMDEKVLNLSYSATCSSNSLWFYVE